MPTATRRFTRREFLGAATALCATPAWAAPVVRLAAAWDEAGGHRVGVLAALGADIVPQASMEVPTRAHGLLVESGGGIVAVARRPGDWMLRWRPGGERAAWAWSEPGRSFNGHAVASADGLSLFTTETDLDSGAGLVGVRDARTLAKRAEWLTHGIDPHELLIDSGTLLVANGGVPTRPETGRIKRDLDRMDSSLVRLSAENGELRSQWRLDDKRLSLRHLARIGSRVGVALQAEHEDAAARTAAPLLALFDGASLRAAPVPHALGGYAGDVAADGSGFTVSCPKSHRVARFGLDGTWRGSFELPEACALAEDERGGLWIGGRPLAARELAPGPGPERRFGLGARRLDNHWAVWTPIAAAHPRGER